MELRIKNLWAAAWTWACSPVGQLVLMLLVVAVAADAASSGDGMPWDRGMSILTNNITGRTAYGLTLVGGAGTAWGMLSHGQMDAVMQRGSHWMLAGGALMSVPSIATQLGFIGAVV